MFKDSNIARGYGAGEDVKIDFNPMGRRTGMRKAKKKWFRGWFEEYECGCTSETERYKKNLCGYCPTHGQDRRHIYPDADFKEASDGK